MGSGTPRRCGLGASAARVVGAVPGGVLDRDEVGGALMEVQHPVGVLRQGFDLVDLEGGRVGVRSHERHGSRLLDGPAVPRRAGRLRGALIGRGTVGGGGRVIRRPVCRLVGRGRLGVRHLRRAGAGGRHLRLVEQ
jgi:hypothetical protein